MPPSRPLATLGCLALATLLSAGPAVGQEIRIDTPQPAAILMASGKQYRGELQFLSDKEVRFKISGFNVVSVYPSTRVRAVQTREDVYMYDLERAAFVGTRNPAPVAAPKEPGADLGAEKPAGENAPARTVVASGVGLTAEEALKVACRNAVQQVVADLVETEARVKSEGVIADKVLSDSGGLVTAHTKLGENVEAGIYQVKIAADVARREVAARLKAAGVIVRGAEGEGQFDGVVIDLEAQKAAAEMIRKAVADYPLNVLRAEVLGKPRLVSKSDTLATFEYEVKFEVDPEKYSAFVKKLVPVLEQVARHKSGGFTFARDCRSQDFLTAESMLEPRRFFPGDPQVQKLQWTGARFLGARAAPVAPETSWGGPGFDPQTGMVLAVSTSHSAAHDKVGWRMYRVPRSRDYNLGLRVDVRFLDRDRKELLRDAFTLVPHPGLVITEKVTKVMALGGPERRGYPFAVLSPYFVAFGPQDWLYATQVIVPQRLTVTHDELRQLDSIQCAVGNADLLHPEAAQVGQ